VNNLEWRKSSRSNAENLCVEVAFAPLLGVAVRDSKNTSGPILTFSVASWDGFRADLRGEQA
jgi:hypothetical protein